jgi:hypothetical protein
MVRMPALYHMVDDFSSGSWATLAEKVANNNYV